MVKRLYQLLALLAMINLFSVAGLVGFLFSTGRLSAERAEQIAKVLRGEWPAEQVATTQPAVAQAPPAASGTEIARHRGAREMTDLVQVRLDRERKDRATLEQRIQLETRQLLEKLEKKEKQLQREKKQLTGTGELLGFERNLAIMSKIDSKQAVDLLRKEMKEPDVVALLIKMEENRVKGIVNACKTEEEKAWIGRILNQINQYDTPAASGGDGPVAPS